MSPAIAIKIFNKPIHSFHFFGATGYFLGLILGICLACFTTLAIWPVILCALAGAGVLFGLTYLYKIITGKEDLVYYQHEIAILICCAILLYLLNLPVLKYLDMSLMGIGTFLVFGRIGCFSVGCCHGRLGKRGVIYTEAHVAEGFHRHFASIPVFPIQLVESASVLVTVIIGSYTILKGLAPGTALLTYTVIYGSVRFALEYFRGDTERPYRLGFSEAQWTTLVVFTVSVIISLYGLLPRYAWHLWALPGLVLWMLVTVAIRNLRRVPSFKLMHPGHILEILQGLEMLENNSSKPGEIFMVKTSANLNISSGKTILVKGTLRHYTLSYKAKDVVVLKKSRLIMDRPTANMLGKLIQNLKHPNTPFEISDGQPGIFHILFTLPAEKIIAGTNKSEALNLRRILRHSYN